eukprot:m.141593 g.141593  ORF g.141593 m.141593 type:complete len:605 (-) comp16131_c0_seq1:795-2609(-)
MAVPAIPLIVQDKLDAAVSQGLDSLLELNPTSINQLATLPVLDSEIVVEELIDSLHARRQANERVDANEQLAAIVARENRIKHSPLGSDKERHIQRLLDRTGYSLFVGPDERRYGGPPPGWGTQAKPTQAEVFIGNLPADCFEDELVPLLERAGPLYELRISMTSNPAVTRQFAVAIFSHQPDSLRAIAMLADAAVRPGCHVTVRAASVDARLFVGGVPRSMARDAILGELQQQAAGVVDVIVYPSVDTNAPNRGFCFVECVDHGTATHLYEALSNGSVRVANRKVTAKWARPEKEDAPGDNSDNMTIYVSNLNPSTSKRDLFDLFEQYGPVSTIRHIRNFAFVTFETHEAAANAKLHHDGKLISGSQIGIVWARPIAAQRGGEPSRERERLRARGVERKGYGRSGRQSPPRHRDRPSRRDDDRGGQVLFGYRPTYDDDRKGRGRRSRSPKGRKGRSDRDGGSFQFGYRPNYESDRGAPVERDAPRRDVAQRGADDYTTPRSVGYNTFEAPSFELPSARPRQEAAYPTMEPPRRYQDDRYQPQAPAYDRQQQPYLPTPNYEPRDEYRPVAQGDRQWQPPPRHQQHYPTPEYNSNRSAYPHTQSY